MAEIVHLNMPTSLIGVWRSDEDDARSEYRISLEYGRLSVTAGDFLDGEQYVVSNISYDHERVEFDTFMPSSARRGHLTLIRTQSPAMAEIHFTFTDSAFATKISEPGRDS
jgi:hypothetical protein